MMNEKQRKKLVIAFLMVLIVFVMGNMVVSPARAQGKPVITVTPDVARVPLGCQVKVELFVENGLAVNAFDVMVQYDSERLDLVDWEFGDYLSNLSVVKEEEQQDSLWLAATQITTPEVSGDGVLLVLFFGTKNTGKAQIELADAIFADAEGQKTYPERLPGEVSVTNASTYTATPTVTSTVTKTTDPAPKGTLTPTRTQTAARTSTDKPTHTLTRSPTTTRTTQSPNATEATITATRTLTPSLTRSDQKTSTTPEPTETAENGYPIQGEVTLTETVLSEETSTSVSGIDPMDEDDPASGEDERTEEGSDGAVVKASQAGWLNVTLWGVLILASLAIVMMLIVLIRRRKDKSEDLLL